MVPRFEQFNLGQVVVFDQPRLAVLFQIARKQEMLIALAEQEAYGIVVLVVRRMFVIVIVQDRHFDAVGNFIGALCAVFVVPAFQRRVVYGAFPRPPRRAAKRNRCTRPCLYSSAQNR